MSKVYSYETMYILRPDLSDEQVQDQIVKYQDFLSDRGAHSVEIQNRGKRRLAYPIKKFQEGTYIQMNYLADGSQIAPMERAMRLSEEVIRYLTLKLEEVKEKLTATAQVEEATAPVADEPTAPATTETEEESQSPAPATAEPTVEAEAEEEPEPTPQATTEEAATEEEAASEGEQEQPAEAQV